MTPSKIDETEAMYPASDPLPYPIGSLDPDAAALAAWATVLCERVKCYCDGLPCGFQCAKCHTIEAIHKVNGFPTNKLTGYTSPDRTPS